MGFFDGWQDAIGGVISGGLSLLGGSMAQDASQSMSREQMEFQQRMSSTAHQREVEDLRAAGLNPILSARLGGSSSPTGAMGTAVNFLGEAARAGVSTALQSRRLESEIALMKSQAAQAESTASLNHAVNVNELLRTTGVQYENLRKKEEAGIAMNQNEITRLETQIQRALAGRAETDEEFYKTEIGSFLRRLGLGAGELGRVFGAGNSGANLLRR